MRILHITNHVLQVGNGIVNVAIDLACSQKKNGHEVSFVSSGGEFELLLEQYGVEHYNMKFEKSIFKVPGMLKNFRSIIKKTQPDIVHAHMMTGAIIAKLYHFNASYKLVTHIHNEFQKSARVMAVGDAVIAVSQAVSDSMETRGISSSKLYVIRNGTINSPRLIPAASKDLLHPAIITVAGMYKRKGIHDLITAFGLLPKEHSAYLYIVGEGPDRKFFEELARNSPRANGIFFEGFQPDPHSYLQSADIFVLASYKDPFPLVLSEARENGCAIIATNVDGIPEALEGGKAGILINAGDVQALSKNILDLIINPVLLGEYSLRSKNNIEWLSVERMTDEVLDLYTKVF